MLVVEFEFSITGGFIDARMARVGATNEKAAPWIIGNLKKSKYYKNLNK